MDKTGFEMIKEMKDMQEKLDEAIVKEHKCKFDLEKSKLALIDEMGEMNHENKASWCWWKFTQKPVDKEKLLEELVDCWHFALSIDNNMNGSLELKSYDLIRYQVVNLSTLIAWAILKTETILAIMWSITEKLGFTIEDVYKAYIDKNKVNYERLSQGY